MWREQRVQRRLAQRILTSLSSLGPCFIKVGQALSTRPDLVRRDWLEQLTQLQDNLPPFPHAIALATIERELGAPADQLFEQFPDYPVAAASLGQVRSVASCRSVSGLVSGSRLALGWATRRRSGASNRASTSV
jgi:predicted unusual protein kinase regulating ubiquinone biosynthesis (AarF/ABC1/UbiB family)